MASKDEIEQTYDYLDPFFRAGLGETGDFTCAFYNGNFKLSLDQAQKAKHKLILKNIQFKPGMRVLDIGCGWGPMLRAVKEAGGEAVGITLSPAQVKSCQRNGLEAYLKDWRNLNVGDYGKFDAIVSVGAIEHFCSVDEYRTGKQDEVYKRFFDLCHKILPKNGKLFLQTFVWDKYRPPIEKISLDAPKGSNERLTALLGKFYPGSWIPENLEQLVKDANNFKLIWNNNGKQDYIQTIKEWVRQTKPANIPLIYLVYGLPLVFAYLSKKDFRLKIQCLKEGGTAEAFHRGIFNHWRTTFEKQ